MFDNDDDDRVLIVPARRDNPPPVTRERCGACGRVPDAVGICGCNYR